MSQPYPPHSAAYWSSDCMVGGCIPFDVYRYDSPENKTQSPASMENHRPSGRDPFTLFVIGVFLMFTGLFIIAVSTQSEQPKQNDLQATTYGYYGPVYWNF